MATNESLKNQLTETKQEVNAQSLGFKSLMNTPTMKKKFQDILHDKSDSFMGSLMTLVGGDDYLAKAEPMTIIAGALKAATMDLPIDKNLGYAYIVPFNRSEKVGSKWIKHNEAQFILGYKGYIQLAQRSGQYKALNALEIYEGQLVSWNPLTEEFVFDYEAKQSDEVVGYVGFFELLNGFKKTVYWTKQEIESHRIKNAKGYEKEKLSGAWKDNYDAMATKTVLRNLLSKWGILSVEMQTAVISDEKVFRATTEDGSLIEEVEIKQAEPATEEPEEKLNFQRDQENEESQTALFDDKKPPLSDD